MDLIDRQAAIDALISFFGLSAEDEYGSAVTEVLNGLPSAQPSADVVERKKGEWVWMGEKGDSRFMCSVCKSKENVPTIMGKPEVWWFCPNCGADMR